MLLKENNTVIYSITRFVQLFSYIFVLFNSIKASNLYREREDKLFSMKFILY